MRPTVLSAGVVVVRMMPRGPRYLLLRAYKHWDFPKGIVEPAEDPLTAACREVEEETGLTDLRFTWGSTHVETEPYSDRKVARYYLAESLAGQVRLQVNPQLGRPEHHEYRWLDSSEAHRLLVPRLQRVLAWAAGHVESAAG